MKCIIKTKKVEYDPEWPELCFYCGLDILEVGLAIIENRERKIFHPSCLDEYFEEMGANCDFD